MAKTIAAVSILCSVSIAFNGCQEPQDVPPLFEDGKVHLYVQEAYEAFPPDVTAAVAGRYGELVEVGMDTARHLFDWRDLEPVPGLHDVDAVTQVMDDRRECGIVHQFCNICVLDSFGPVVPSQIEDLVERGAGWDDPRITGAFADLLDAVVPAMQARGMFLLGLSNEPGGYYEDEPGRAASFAGFIEAAVRHVHRAYPNVPCTVVFAGPGDPAIPHVMPLLDVASFNQHLYTASRDPGCTMMGEPLPLYRSVAPAQVGLLLDELIAAAGGKPVTVQEIGQSTGWNDVPQTLGAHAGLSNQRACIAALREALHARREHFAAVCLWTLNDHTPPGMQYVADALLAEGIPSCYADNITEIFGPTGLVRSDRTASAKPAFDAFKEAVAFFAEEPLTP